MKHLNLFVAQARHLHDTGSLLVVLPCRAPSDPSKRNCMGPLPLGKPGDVVLCREPWADVNTESGPAFMYGNGALRFCEEDAWPVEYERYPGCQFSMWWSDLYHAKARKCTDDHKWRSVTSIPEFLIRLRPVIKSVECRRVATITEVESRQTGIALASVRDWETVTMTPARDEFAEHWHRRHRRRGPEYGFESAWGFFYTLTLEKGTSR